MVGSCTPKSYIQNTLLYLGTETPAPVTGAAADEYNLNVVDCNASVTVARPAVLNLSQLGSGGFPQPCDSDCVWTCVQPPEAANVNLEMVWFSVASPRGGKRR